MNAEMFFGLAKAVMFGSLALLLLSIWWRSRKQPVRREWTDPYPQPFRGWEPVNDGTAGVGQIGPALIDLNRRLEEIESFLVIDRDTGR